MLRLMGESIVILWVASVSLCVGASQRIPFICFGAKPTQRACARDLPRDRKWTREGRSERRQKKAVDKGELKKTVDRDESSLLKKGPIDRTGQSGRWESDREDTSQQKSERRLLGPVDLQMPGGPTREVKSTLLMSLWEFSLELTETKNVQKVSHRLPPFLCLELTQVRVCSFVLFFYPLGCALRICKEMWNTPDKRWEKTLDESLAMSGFYFVWNWFIAKGISILQKYFFWDYSKLHQIRVLAGSTQNFTTINKFIYIYIYL